MNNLYVKVPYSSTRTITHSNKYNMLHLEKIYTEAFS